MNDLRLIQRRINKSKEVITEMLSRSQKPYIALSFGKDSLAMLALVYSIRPGIPCLFLKSEESFLMYNYEELIDWYRQRLHIVLQIVETNRLSEHGFDWNKARKAGNRDFYRDEFFDGYDGVFMGLRIDESKARRFTLLKCYKDNYLLQYKAGRRKDMWRACPMAEWNGWEVLHYLKCHDLPFLDIYNEGHHIRTTARITGDAHRQNALFWIKKNNPENWNKLIRLMPELKVL